MKIKLQNQLYEDFPFMAARNVWSGEFCLDEHGKKHGFPCSCGDGWYNLLHNLCQELNELYVSRGINPLKILPLQIKEKYGGLRFYTDPLIDDAFDIIRKYEEMSYCTCEICGEEGGLCRRGSWYQTLCDKHAVENGYIKSESE